ncbi:hypothetical protein [Nocardia asiatica]|uniref:hypothetical protein n=1 Tax=Nocardia asiatica TaxID=209252 RepID=UPI002458581D|nr:hypothetical protein [Nocardia asiatica]
MGGVDAATSMTPHDQALRTGHCGRIARQKEIDDMNLVHMLCQWMCSLMGGCPMMGQPM